MHDSIMLLLLASPPTTDFACWEFSMFSHPQEISEIKKVGMHCTFCKLLSVKKHKPESR